ncbi:MAG TPA: MDR family MFS transporter [Acetobacteraceae bacterium]|nr:MDR family MFS transporter [Acetobacteraceae bacterium]
MAADLHAARHAAAGQRNVQAAAEAIPMPHAAARRSLVLAACIMATFMAAVESTIVATAMPTIIADLGGFKLFSWVFAVYLLTTAISIPIYGRLADIYGRKSVFHLGAGLFLIGSTLSGFAPGMVWLVVFRALQGLGAGGVQPIAMTICGDIYTPAERARVQGLISSVFGVAAVTGPSLGAFLVEHVGWRTVFWVNIPIGAAAILMISLFLQENVERRSHKVDYPGSLLMMLSVGALMLALVQGSFLSAAIVWTAGTIGVVGLAALMLHEARAPEPMLPLELWRDRVIVIGSLGGGLAGAVMMGVSAFLPTYVQGALGRSPLTAGLVLGCMSVTWAIASIFGGRLMVRTTYRLAATLGALSLLAGSLILVALTPERGVPWASAGSLVMGVGMGLCNTAFIVSIQAAVPWRKRGAATSSCLFLRFIGQALGAASFGAVLNTTIQHRAPQAVTLVNRLLEPDSRDTLTEAMRVRLVDLISAGLHNAYWLAVGMSVVTLLLVLRLPARLSPSQQTLR